MPATYYFLSPMLAPNQAWIAFQMRAFPRCEAGADAPNANFSCTKALTEQFPLFFSTLPAWLHDAEFIKNVRQNQAILALPPGVAGVPTEESVCKQLRQNGGHLAIEVADSAIIKTISATTFNHLVFDATKARDAVPLIDLINAHQFGFQLVATGVTGHELFDWATAKRFTLLSSEFINFADPRVPVDADTTRLKLLKLLSLVVQDADTCEIEEIFKQEPKLSYNLLRLVNSVAVGPKTPITGFNQAITVLGRRQLQRWIQLLIYANQFGQGGQPNPLLQLAAARGRRMELLAAPLPAIPDVADIGEAAFMTGIFSLLDTLLNIPMMEILAALPLAEPIADALLHRRGMLGALLDAVASADMGDLQAASSQLEALGLPPETYLAAQSSAFSWASKIAFE